MTLKCNTMAALALVLAGCSTQPCETVKETRFKYGDKVKLTGFYERCTGKVSGRTKEKRAVVHVECDIGWWEEVMDDSELSLIDGGKAGQ